MLDAQRATVGDHRDHVEAAAVEPGSLGRAVSLGETAKPAPLRVVDAFEWLDEIVAGSGLDLDEDEGASFARHDVELTARNPPVAVEDPHPPPPEMPRRGVFPCHLQVPPIHGQRIGRGGDNSAGRRRAPHARMRG